MVFVLCWRSEGVGKLVAGSHSMCLQPEDPCPGPAWVAEGSDDSVHLGGCCSGLQEGEPQATSLHAPDCDAVLDSGPPVLAVQELPQEVLEGAELPHGGGRDGKAEDEEGLDEGPGHYSLAKWGNSGKSRQLY